MPELSDNSAYILARAIETHAAALRYFADKVHMRRRLDTMKQEASDHLPISALRLSVRARHGLDAAGITTIGELRTRSARDLLLIRGFGRTSLRELCKALVPFGATLAGDDFGTLQE